MKRLAAIAAILLATLISTTAFANTSDEAAIIEIEHGLAAAQTIDQMMKFYAPGDETVLFDAVVPGILHGSKAIRDGLTPQLIGLKSIKIDFKELTVGSNGPLGYAFSVQHATIAKADGTSMEVTFRQTDVLRKIDGQWFIIHQQFSYPADPKTGMAAFNISP